MYAEGKDVSPLTLLVYLSGAVLARACRLEGRGAEKKTVAKKMCVSDISIYHVCGSM